MKETINKKACWQKTLLWKHSRLIAFQDLALTDKQKDAIRNGQKIVQGKWIFEPCYFEKGEEV